MARLITCGWEAGHQNEQAASVAGSVTADTTVVRTGTYSLKCDSGAGATTNVRLTLSGSLSTQYYARVYFRFSTNPANTLRFLTIGASASTGGSLSLTTTGAVDLRLGGTTIGTSSVLATDTWHLAQLRFMEVAGTTADEVEGFINGASLGSATGNSATVDAAPNGVYLGWNASTAGASRVIYFDDFALNDGSGASQNTFPDEGKVVLLKPVSDSAVGTGWQKPGGATTNLWSSIDGPPLGVADSTNAAQAENQIRNATSTTTGNHDSVTGTYTAAGISGSDTISVVHPIATVSSAVTQASSGAITTTANPSTGSEVTFSWNQSAAAGTFPTGWGWVAGTPIYAPTPTLGTGVTLRIGKRTSSTRVSLCCFAGVYADYVVGASGTTFPQTVTASSTASPSRTAQAGKLVTRTASAAPTATKTPGKLVVRTATGTVTLVRRPEKVATASATGTSTIAAVRVFLHELAVAAVSALIATRNVLATRSATATGTTARTSIASFLRMVSASATGAPVLTRISAFLRALTSSATGTATATRQPARTSSATATATPTLTPIGLVSRTLSAATTAASAILRAVGASRSTAGVGTPATTRQAQIARGAGATGAPVLAALRAILRSLSTSGTGTSSASRMVASEKAASASGAPEMIKSAARTASAAATGTAFLQAASSLVFRVLEATASGAVAIIRRAAPVRAAASTATATIVRAISVVRSAAASGTATLLKQPALARSAAATGAATLAALRSLFHLTAGAASGTAAVVRRAMPVRDAGASGEPAMVRATSLSATTQALGSAFINASAGAGLILQASATALASIVRRPLVVLGASVVTVATRVALRIGSGLAHVVGSVRARVMVGGRARSAPGQASASVITRVVSRARERVEVR